MKIADLTPEIAQCSFDEFWEAWLSTWAAAHQLQHSPRTSYTYFKGYVANDEEDNQ